MLSEESDAVLKADLLASPQVQAALSSFIGGVIDWRETDDYRMLPGPRSSRLLGEGHGSTEGENRFIGAGEEVERRYGDLRTVVRAELGRHRRDYMRVMCS